MKRSMTARTLSSFSSITVSRSSVVTKRYATRVPELKLTVGADQPFTDEETDKLAEMMRYLHLANMVLQVLGSAQMAWFFFNLQSRGKLNYTVRWHFEHWTGEWRESREFEKRLRLDIGRVIYEAARIVEGAAGA